MPQEWNFTDADREQSRKREQRRRERINSLPRDWRGDDKEQTLLMFDYKCAYCGAQQEDKVLQFDHYIDVYQDDCPGTLAGNMVPSCHSCNRKKGNKGVEWVDESRREDIENTLSSLGAYWL
jgi:5-methylcytosine-specific restriction endonuclease McrA